LQIWAKIPPWLTVFPEDDGVWRTLWIIKSCGFRREDSMFHNVNFTTCWPGVDFQNINQNKRRLHLYFLPNNHIAGHVWSTGTFARTSTRPYLVNLGLIGRSKLFIYTLSLYNFLFFFTSLVYLNQQLSFRSDSYNVVLHCYTNFHWQVIVSDGNHFSALHCPFVSNSSDQTKSL
jgi:hypothetical protein